MSLTDQQMVPQEKAEEISIAKQQSKEAQEELNQITGHSIMLVQFSSNEETRSYIDCKSPDAVLETLLRIYEEFLLNKNKILEAKDEVKGEGSTNQEEKYRC